MSDETRYWRCKRCETAHPGRNPDFNGRGYCSRCDTVVDFDPVVVLPVAEYERLRGIEERLREPCVGDERYARLAHAAYCGCYLLHKGEPYWTGGDYDKLDATYKGYDQTMADSVIDTYRRAVLGKEKP